MQMQMLDFTDEQKQMRQLARDFTDKEIIPFVSRDREREWTAPASERMPWELLKKADKLGLRGLGVPEKYGGIKLEDQAQTYAIIAEELARGDSGFADIMGQVWKVPVLLGNIMPEHFQDEWFPKFMEDPTFLIAHCLTEPRGASDRWLPYNVPEAAMNTKAELKDGHWTLNGRKQFITNGYDAKLYIVYANTNPKVGMMQGTSSFLIPRDTPGLIPVRTNEKMGARYMNNGEILFDNCRIPEDHILVKDEALKHAGVYFRPGKILQAAKNLGVGVAAFEKTAAYVQQYVQGGKIIIKHQAIANTLADMAIKVETTRAFTRYAARALDNNTSDALQLCMMAKVYAADAIFDVAKKAMEIFAGNGVMIEMGIEKHFRDAAVFLHMDGTQDIHRFKVIRAMFPETAGNYAGND
ncbi:MAG: acyl-CoA dehydrogenase family protein [Anaerolineales bacterium]|nr:acyl-CoA dehydrogenase family protein [Anaerolineales bacterium]